MIIFTTWYSKSYQTGTSLSLKIVPGRLYELVLNYNNNNNNNICLFPPFADFSELQVGSGKALTNIQLYITADSTVSAFWASSVQC